MSIKKSRSAAKRNRQNEKRKVRNKMIITRSRHTAKSVLAFIEAKNKDQAKAEFIKFSSYVDKAAQKGIIGKNTAARKKSRMQKKIGALA